MKKILLLPVVFLGLILSTMAQDAPEEKAAPAKKKVKVTFNATKIVNQQSVEIVSKSTLQFMVSHHYITICYSSCILFKTSTGNSDRY